MKIEIETKYDIGQNVRVKYGNRAGISFVIDCISISASVPDGGDEFIEYTGMIGPCRAWRYFEKQLELSDVDMRGLKYEVEEGDIIIWDGKEYTIVNYDIKYDRGQAYMGSPVETYGYEITLTLEDEDGYKMDVKWDDKNKPLRVVGKKVKQYV